MFVAGFLFLVYWIFFALVDHRYRKDGELKTPTQPHQRRKSWPEYKAKNAPVRETPIYLGFALFGLPMCVLSIALLDAVVALANVQSLQDSG